MRKTIRFALLTIVAFTTLSALAQGPGSRGGGRGSPGARLYDPTTVTTVSGQVTSIDPTGPAGLGLHLALETAHGKLLVHLGPSWFLQAQSLQIAVGDTLEITGSRVTFEQAPAVIAQTVKKADQVLVLRDVQGTPMWAGRGGGRGGGRRGP